MSYDADVVVAGGGPVGLMLACELRLGGVSVVVLERLTEVSTTIKAGALNAPSVEALYRRGLLPALAEAQKHNMEQLSAFMRQRSTGSSEPAGSASGRPSSTPAEPSAAPPKPAGPGTAPRTPPKFAGHFAGIMLDGKWFDGDDPGFGGLGPAGEIGFVNQQQLEMILGERAAELGVDLRRGVELTGFDADADGVTVATTGPSIRARWLVGCDGGRSTVRKLAGFDFPGTDPEITAYQALAEMDGTQDLGAGWNSTPTGIYAHGPVPGRILTVQFTGPRADRDAPVTEEELEESIRHVTGADIRVKEIRSATRFTDNARQASTYRLGRVLLAGDAAHVHSPFGGQGLNLGLGDAVNLGWKLAATIRGWAPEGLLDSYTSERHPIGAWVLDWTRAQVALMRPEVKARALREVVRELTQTVTGTTFLVKKISGVWQRYDIPGDHPLVGASAPDLEFGDGSRLADHLRDGKGLLVDPSGTLAAAVDGYGDRLNVIPANCPERPDLLGLFVRPDGFVAWAAEGTDAGPDPLRKAVATWLGAPGLHS
ncbi:FAD-dependent monooxygenase [Sphaerisporangium fuscum]|uniref:FAD-dependent monooxygenase n=1 Tax=Sphaerisporangium fuscum TaxID=2835868 RepID=UPI001BDBDE26|nr:FAD-dependent monooxygenase [Sphaerisporangium fuscum]